MTQYLELLKEIIDKGTKKPPAREDMPGTTSLFGYQFRCDLQKGFPLLTTKRIFWKGVVTELLWFLRGETNIKYLLDNNVHIWDEDAYNYYLKKCKEVGANYPASFEQFIRFIKDGLGFDVCESLQKIGYTYGDCGFQYGKVWRRWGSPSKDNMGFYKKGSIDQIKNLIEGLQNNPEGRRHIVTAIDPVHDSDLALFWCHAMFQFNCRPIPHQERQIVSGKPTGDWNLEHFNVPKYYLDCHLYQRSADAVLGVPFNIASYALLTHIIAKLCNMIPGDFVHSFGDLHIYDNHLGAVAEQLTRKPTQSPELVLPNIICEDLGYLNETIHTLSPSDFTLNDYRPQAPIYAELSTGLRKTQ